MSDATRRVTTVTDEKQILEELNLQRLEKHAKKQTEKLMSALDGRRRGLLLSKLDPKHQPFSFDYWRFVTDGHALLAFDAPFIKADPSPYKVTDLFNAEAQGTFFDLGNLKTFLGKKPAPIPCDSCNGEGVVTCSGCEGGGYECSTCEGEREYKCPKCPNLKRRKRQVKMFGSLFDAHLLRDFLAPVEGESYRVGPFLGKQSHLALIGESWRLCIMPMIQGETDEQYEPQKLK